MIRTSLASRISILCSLVLAGTLCPSQTRAQSVHPQHPTNVQQMQALQHQKTMQAQSFRVWIEQQMHQQQQVMQQQQLLLQKQQQQLAALQGGTSPALAQHHACTTQQTAVQTQQLSNAAAMRSMTHAFAHAHQAQAAPGDPCSCNHSLQQLMTVSGNQSTLTQSPIAQQSRYLRSALTSTRQALPSQTTQDPGTLHHPHHQATALQSVSTAASNTPTTCANKNHATQQTLLANPSASTLPTKPMHEHWREQQALLNRSQDPTRNLQTSQTALQQPLQSSLLPASPLASTSLTGTTQSCQPTQLLSTSNNLQSVTTTQRQCAKQQSLFRNRGNPANLSQQTAPTQTPTSTCSMQPPTSMQTPISAVAQQPNYQAAILVIVYDVFGTNPSFNTGAYQQPATQGTPNALPPLFQDILQSIANQQAASAQTNPVQQTPSTQSTTVSQPSTTPSNTVQPSSAPANPLRQTSSPSRVSWSRAN